MLYAIICEDVPNSLPLRKATRPAHIERLQMLKEQNRVVLAGPHPAIDSKDPGEAGFTGSLMIIEFASLEEAQTWADADPYALEGIFKSWTVKPFNQVLP